MAVIKVKLPKHINKSKRKEVMEESIKNLVKEKFFEYIKKHNDAGEYVDPENFKFGEYYAQKILNGIELYIIPYNSYGTITRKKPLMFLPYKENVEKIQKRFLRKNIKTEIRIDTELGKMIKTNDKLLELRREREENEELLNALPEKERTNLLREQKLKNILK